MTKTSAFSRSLTASAAAPAVVVPAGTSSQPASSIAAPPVPLPSQRRKTVSIESESKANRVTLSQVLGRLQALPASSDRDFIARYVGGVGHPDRAPDEQSKMQFLGLKLPQVYSVSKLVDTSNLTLDVLHHAASQATHFEEMIVHVNLLKNLDEKMHFTVPQLEPFIDYVDNWAVSDFLSQIIANAFERHITTLYDSNSNARADPTRGAAKTTAKGKNMDAAAKEEWARKARNPPFDYSSDPIFGMFRKWNVSSNPWMRRQSLVDMIYYASQRRVYPPSQFVLSQVEALLTDPHFYVQKGVGWTLRELYQYDPDAQLRFVQENLHKISATAWTATGERYSEELRKRLVLQRRSTRRTQTGNRAASKRVTAQFGVKLEDELKSAQNELQKFEDELHQDKYLETKGEASSARRRKTGIEANLTSTLANPSFGDKLDAAELNASVTLSPTPVRKRRK